MRFALFFAARSLTLAMVLAYVLAMLAASCLPVADASGQIQAIPRWEYWLLHASVPSAIWWQWTGGLQPIVVFDRLPILTAAFSWMLGCLWVGKLVCRFDPISNRLSKYERLGVSILVGQSILSTIVFVYGSLLGTATLAWLTCPWLLLSVIQWRYDRHQEFVVPPPKNSVDTSFSTSISRRMVGLLFLAGAYLACVQVYGATIPTRDMDVREVDWWIAKQATSEGKIVWAKDHMMGNAPANFGMPAVFFASVMTYDLPIVSSTRVLTLAEREHWNKRLKTSVLAGKTVNATLCLVGILLAAVHLGRKWGYLAGLFVSIVLLSTPGLVEMARLGRTEALTGIWGVALLVIWQAWMDARDEKLPVGILFGFLVAGAFSTGYGSAVLVGLPAVVFGLPIFFSKLRVNAKGASSITTGVLFLLIAISACSFYIRNAVASGDPIAPWGQVLLQQTGMTKSGRQANAYLHAWRAPVETTQEAIEANSAEGIHTTSEANSPYRFANFLDGVLRFIGNSNAHGLVLIPFAILGGFLGGSKTNGVAIVWTFYWIAIWWGFTPRQDRDWVAVLFLLAWPVATGAKWMAAQVRGYFMFVVVALVIVWSVVVIPIWPTSDNRILVGLDQIERGQIDLPGSKMGDDSPSTMTYTSQFNAFARSSNSPPSKVLMVGENDDFDLVSMCVSNGAFDECMLDPLVDLSGKEIGAELRSRGISHLLVVWTGVRFREKWTGLDRENEYRTVIEKLLKESQMQPIAWKISSSQAELFEVNEM